MARAEIAPQAFLAALPLFKALDAAALTRLAQATTRRPLRRGERLFAKGDQPTGMYVVVYGEIRLVARSPARGERLTGVVGAGRSFGEPVMFLEKPAVVDAEAAADSLVLHLPKQAVFDEIERSPLFARRIIASLSQRVESLVNELDRQSTGSARARLIDYLLRSAGRGPGAGAVTLPAAKAAIASHLNLSPEHFSRVLHELVAAGLLQVQGRRITVPDRERLERSAQP
ncbi:Crp/Fnr family transcriptional regulator [Caenimonas terrae]|uniref:Crp/Fnr family transcriptional regulator n=1 Tax=Caenimonas terrae TaxID=696074 RepID=A0ABW0ND54_9BURK